MPTLITCLDHTLSTATRARHQRRYPQSLWAPSGKVTVALANKYWETKGSDYSASKGGATIPVQNAFVDILIIKSADAKILPSLDEVRSFHADRMRELPDELRGVRPSDSYRVDVSETLRALAKGVQGRLGSAAAFTSHNPPKSRF